MSIQIAIVDDDPDYRSQIQRYILRYAANHPDPLQVTTYTNGFEIVNSYDGSLDIIFMDVEMPHMDGMEAARRIRKADKDVVIIFITNLAQYGLLGYQVEALDYVLKPIEYFDFTQELFKAIKKVKEHRGFYFRIFGESNMLRLDASTVTYLESQGNNVIFHTTEGTHTVRDTLKNWEQQLSSHHFSRCNNCYLVNLAHVERVDKLLLIVAGEELQISRPRRKAFMEDMAAYIGRG